MSREAAMAAATATIPTGTNEAVAVAAAPETPATEAAAPAATSKEIDSARFARLAKREAELQAIREQVKKDQQQAQDVLRKAKEFDEMKKSDPVSALKAIGFTETDIINFLSDGQEVEQTPEQKAAAAAQAEIKKFEEKQAQKAKEEQTRQDQQLITNLRKRIGQTITSDADNLEFCSFMGAEAETLVYELMATDLRERRKTDANATLMPIADAAKEVESYLEGYYKGMANKVKKLNPQEATPPAAAAPPPASSRTISNRATATAASTIPKAETMSEKRQRLINMIKQNGLRR
jgi:hypothetical protein